MYLMGNLIDFRKMLGFHSNRKWILTSFLLFAIFVSFSIALYYYIYVMSRTLHSCIVMYCIACKCIVRVLSFMCCFCTAYFSLVQNRCKSGITLHYITLHYITLHYITLHYITLHYTTLHCASYIAWLRCNERIVFHIVVQYALYCMIVFHCIVLYIALCMLHCFVR